MDVGNFIGELLVQRGDVSVPGLGYFARTRTNGHYNEHESKLYPPAYSVYFNPKHVEDETLIQYIAGKKNISLASSKYFTEKYITNIKLQAQSEETPLADLGWFYTEGTQLFFRPGNYIGDNPDFFGYEPLTLHKLGTAPVEKTDFSDISNTPAEETYAVTVTQKEDTADSNRFETDVEHEEYLESLARKRRRNANMVFIILAALFTALIIYLVHHYNPSVFNLEANRPPAAKTEPVINARVVPVDTIANSDTASLKQNTPAKDTLAKVSALPADSIGFPRWEVMGSTFKTRDAANTAIRNYKTLGVTAHIASDVPGPRYHVSLGTYKTYKEAAAATNTLKKDKKINSGIYPLEIKHKK